MLAAPSARWTAQDPAEAAGKSEEVWKAAACSDLGKTEVGLRGKQSCGAFQAEPRMQAGDSAAVMRLAERLHAGTRERHGASGLLDGDRLVAVAREPEEQALGNGGIVVGLQ